MKTAIAIFCALIYGLPASAGEEQKQPAKDAAPSPSLVETAKQAKAKRRTSSTKVITNKDVKKSKGKLIVLSTPVDDKPAAPTETTGPLQKQDTKYRQRKDAQEHLDAVQKKVDGLQKALESIEQQYYEENDPNYRDQVIQKRFAQTKRQLEDAQQELADARDALKKIDSE
jgi:paraquat-inducible protein B